MVMTGSFESLYAVGAEPEGLLDVFRTKPAGVILVLQGRESSAEKKYRKLLLGMDMTHDFFFSYTYSIAMSLQRNLTAPASSQGAGRFDSMFVWNCHLTRCVRSSSYQ